MRGLYMQGEDASIKSCLELICINAGAVLDILIRSRMFMKENAKGFA
jgi:hypothetical protein